MRTKDEIKAGLFKALDSVIKKTFYKKNFNDSFTEEELVKIKEIDKFIREVSLYKGEEVLRQFMSRQYFIISCKSEVKVNGREICVFKEKAIPVEDFDYKKIEYYVAKCIYRVAQNRHIELYYGVNTFRALQMPSGIYLPERCGANASMTGSVFMDIDLSDEGISLSNEELLEALKEDFEELFINLPPTYIIRSGGGIHIYYSLEQSIDIFMNEQKELWKDTMRTLAQIFKRWGADFKIIDTARILRLPHSINRKAKYGKNGKEVEVMEYTGKRYEINDLRAKLKFIEEGGMEDLLKEITDETFMEEIYGPVFIEVEMEEDIFGDDDLSYQNFIPRKTEEVMETQNEETAESNEAVAEIKQKKEKALTTAKKVKRNLLAKKDFQYRGVRARFKVKETFWQNRDILQWLSDRDNHEGVRNDVLFLLAYNWYNFCKTRTYEKMWEKYQTINSFFRPSLPEEELEKYCRNNFSTLEKRVIKTKCIRNETIQKYLPFTEEEKKSGRLQGIYTDTREEYERKRQERNNEARRKKYKDTHNEPWKRTKRKEMHLEVLKENPKMSGKEFREKTGLSKEMYVKYRKELGLTETNEEKRERITQERLQPFINNPDISEKEYMELMNCSRSTYIKYKRIYRERYTDYYI